ncbi:DNA-(apurinic or apyrimidinic site) lyase [Hydrogenispora ethanolica]|uniref:Formamidopyrimidine-DNA glycosylase n=1 Tax=Hydrogenispora ethanolica TaxID=1082276 RepID=A0A4R1RW61_HYDET|nr:DNA-formamidopyrimidine glycosylase [Hydrogenispora ethanolica]TCL70816.1 DNA-(apurinic or apyrimidinic site) lyase [Hydrogenispora ethanolica]
MPELPEVESIRLTIAPKLTGRTILSGKVHHPKLVQNISTVEFLREIQGKEIVGLDRRGKYLLLRLAGEMTLSIHLRMTGQLTVAPGGEPPADATYLQLVLDNGTELRFRDQRKFGRVALFPSAAIPANLARLGPEPLDDSFTVAVFEKQLARRKLAVKKALLDQSIIAGVGNIYADEALFVAGIHPARSLDTLTEAELVKLHGAIRQVLAEGIEYRGTTKRDYRDGEGNPGGYQDRLRVYGRKGQPCPICQAPIAKMIFGGRGTHFCPLCQS